MKSRMSEANRIRLLDFLIFMLKLPVCGVESSLPGDKAGAAGFDHVNGFMAGIRLPAFPAICPARAIGYFIFFAWNVPLASGPAKPL